MSYDPYEIVAKDAEIARLTERDKRIVSLEAVLDECLEYLDDREDVQDSSDGQPRPNQAMRLASTIREALGRACI